MPHRIVFERRRRQRFFLNPDLDHLDLAHRLPKNQNTSDVVVHGLMPPSEVLKTTKALESEFGVRARFSNADVTEPAEIRAMIKKTQEELGSLDILCNNVGIQHVESVVDFPEDK